MTSPYGELARFTTTFRSVVLDRSIGMIVLTTCIASLDIASDYLLGALQRSPKRPDCLQ